VLSLSKHEGRLTDDRGGIPVPLLRMGKAL
jgi:hypothetical protein